MAREIPKDIPWYRQPLAQMFMAGFLPFSAIYIELHYIFASVWGHKIYTLFGILFIAFIMLFIVTSFITVALVYFQVLSWCRCYFQNKNKPCGATTYTNFPVFSVLNCALVLMLSPHVECPRHLTPTSFLSCVVVFAVSSLLPFAQLAREDHRWWWRSFFSGGSTGLFIYAYSFFYFFQRSSMDGMLQGSFYFG